MSIKKNGGIFGRNPTYYNVEVENDLRVGGDLIINGETVTGLDFEGSWDASTNTPDVTASPTVGQFWIVSVAGNTDLSGITTWDVGDWALYDGSSWQRVEGGGNGTFTKVNVDNLQLDGNTISSTDTDGNIALVPDGAGIITGKRLSLTGTTNDPLLLLKANNDSGNPGLSNTLRFEDTDITVQPGQQTGRIEFYMNDSYGAGPGVNSYINVDSDQYGRPELTIGTGETGAVSERVSIDYLGNIVFNETGADADFRVESDNNANMLFVDAGNDRVGVGGTANQSNAVLSINTTASKHGKSIESVSSITGGGEKAIMAEGVVAVDTTSLGTVLSIPINSQGTRWRRFIIQFMFSSGEYGLNSNSKSGSATISFASLTSLTTVSLQDSTGNVASVGSSGTDLQITFTNGFTNGISDWEGVLVYYKILASEPNYVQMWNASLN